MMHKSSFSALSAVMLELKLKIGMSAYNNNMVTNFSLNQINNSITLIGRNIINKNTEIFAASKSQFQYNLRLFTSYVLY